MYLILFESLTKTVYHSFYAMCKTLNQSGEGFYKSEKALSYQLKREIIN